MLPVLSVLRIQILGLLTQYAVRFTYVTILSMKALERFVSERQANWGRLESLAGRAQTGRVHDLTADELDEMTRLYRVAASDLAAARRDFPGDRVVAYLNRLVASSYSTVYGAAGWNWREIVRWYAGGFPRLFRATVGYYLLAALLFFGTGLLAFVATVTYPPAARVLLPPNEYQAVSSYAERGELWTEIPTVERSAAAATIMTNNIQVAILAFGGGMLLGLGTALVLIYNGLQLGAIFGIVTINGLGFRLLAFVSGHGVIELSVICLAGGAGLMLADAILRPGMLTRGEALRLAAGRSVRLLLGGASLLVIAGMIEGFVSPSGLPDVVKFGTGVVTGVLLYGYWLGVGRGVPRET